MERKGTYRKWAFVVCLCCTAQVHAQEAKTKEDTVPFPSSAKTYVRTTVEAPPAAAAAGQATGPIHHSITALPTKGVVSFYTRTARPAVLSCRIVNKAGAVIANWQNEKAEEQLFINVPESQFQQGSPFIWEITDKQSGKTERVSFNENDCQPRAIEGKR